jgi:hypothetical protein
MWFLAGIGGVIVVALLAALVTDVHDRGRGGVRKIRMPGWFDRRARGRLMMSPLNWDTSDDRLKSPREREDGR